MRDRLLGGSGRLDAHRAVRRVLRSQLTLQQSTFAFQSTQADPSITTMIRIDNPSLEAMVVTATLASNLPWLSMSGPGVTTISDEASYGDPAFLPMVVSPSAVAAGIYSAQVLIVGARLDMSQVTTTVMVDLFIRSAIENVVDATTTTGTDTLIYLPSIFNLSAPTNPTPLPTPLPTS